MLSQVANDYYTLASPYPERLVAVISQQSQIVDSTGRSVPLSEVSCILLLIEFQLPVQSMLQGRLMAPSC